MKRKKIAAANWKMNLTPAQGVELIAALKAGVTGPVACEVVIAPPFTHLPAVIGALDGTGFHTAAQHCHPEKNGAFTGEISVGMLKSLGVTHVIVGHSERRQLFHETDDFIRMKVDAILDAGLVAIFCCGESLDIREAGNQNEYVRQQLDRALFHLEADQWSNVVIAYEPVWAIGTGVTASPDQAQEMHAYLRQTIAAQYSEAMADKVRILYGGSVKADNAAELFGQPDVDGGLVGGASLDADAFATIIEAACG